MLKYTGHPLVDVGVATIAAFVGKRDPTQVTESDLDKVVEYITREYTRQPLVSFLTVVFPNSGFTQPAYEKQPEKKQLYAERVLQSYRPETPLLSVADIFTGQPAVDVPFDVKGELKPGYAFRQHIPLLTGEGVINFYPGGEAGLPVSGTTLLALQAFPLGCAKCRGRLLAVHSDNNELTYNFARVFLQRNRQSIQLAQQSGEKKMPETQYAQKTLLIDVLIALQAETKQIEEDRDNHLASLTAYHLSNSGQGPSLDIYHLPLEMFAFLKEMQTADYRDQWNAIVRRAWEVAPAKKGGKEEEFRPRYNWLYEDLFDLPGSAPRFIRTYFLRVALRYARGKTDPRVSYSLRDEAGLVSWPVTERFLRRIMHMEKERVEQIRTLGDQLADYVIGQNDRRFFREFFTVQRYDYFRTILIKANLAHVKRGNPPIIRLDPYIEVFEEGDALARSDWRLARDLVLIRLVENLYERGWLRQNVDAIPERTTEEENQSEGTVEKEE